jgi:hypothetical protein
MKIPGWFLLTVTLLLALGGLGALLTCLSAAPTGTVTGVVVDAAGPVAGATVRVRATENVTLTTPEGRFSLGMLLEGHEIEITAWAEGYYIASIPVTPTVADITLVLRPHHTMDHPTYSWASPISGTSDGACGNCHPMIVSQWITNAHGKAVSNPRFYSLYNGTDVSGTNTITPGYILDFPSTAGQCANCHAPGAGVDGYLSTDMNVIRDTVTAGIHCDYCHKVGGVFLNSATGSVYANAPGARSQRLLRPPPGEEIFFGPYDDIHDPDTYLPAISESAFCAPCHQFSMWGTPIYESYQEWLRSSYAAEGVTCQRCHMPPTGDTYFALPEAGGLAHPPQDIPSHLQLGAQAVELLQDTVTMDVSAVQMAGSMEVTVVITNTGAGHHIPTDYPGRHALLVVTATDDQGASLSQWSGPVVPGWGGVQAGLPGKAYAKVLRDVQTDESPVVSYWRQTQIVSDNRIPALDSDTSTYVFAAPESGSLVTVTAELRFRRVFQEVMDAKGWDTPDILMEAITTTLLVQPRWEVFVPLVVRALPAPE